MFIHSTSKSGDDKEKPGNGRDKDNNDEDEEKFGYLHLYLKHCINTTTIHSLYLHSSHESHFSVRSDDFRFSVIL